MKLTKKERKRIYLKAIEKFAAREQFFSDFKIPEKVSRVGICFYLRISAKECGHRDYNNVLIDLPEFLLFKNKSLRQYWYKENEKNLFLKRTLVLLFCYQMCK